MIYAVYHSRNAIYTKEFSSRRKAEQYIHDMKLRLIPGTWTINPRPNEHEESMKQFPDETITDECTEHRIFYVERWQVGYANLWAFVPNDGCKHISDLGVNETTEGRCTNPTSDKKPERITRIR
jgi:hypothetical protein